MNLEQTILNHLNKLPLGKQQEVLDFVEFLTTRVSPPRPLDDQKDPPRLSMGALRQSLEGAYADLGVHLTQEDITAARREMWGNGLREVN